MKIICVGRNYAEHARELNNEVPADPVLFMKPETALILPRQPFFYPDFSKDIHHEIELVVRINRLGKHIEPQFAHRYYNEVALGIDFTARDIQQQLKAKGLPWEKAKAFDGSACVGEWISVEKLGDIQNLNFYLTRNGEIVQSGNTSHMLFSVNHLISYISSFFTLKIGDLIFTGTPSGVGPVNINDTLEGYLEGRKNFSLRIK
ncbi:MAG: fumarylacetoacetate hydrolase family protein [Flavobacteriales bacterium]|nr:fumarylacetoacetate hydrolase family protein [Flavobacteriales bacterium]